MAQLSSESPKPQNMRSKYILTILLCISLPFIEGKRNKKDKKPSKKSTSLCSLEWSKNLPSWFPMIWNDSSIIYPEKQGDKKWAINLPSNAELNFSCSENSNQLSKFKRPFVTAKCDEGKLTVDGKAHTFGNFGCAKKLNEKVVKTGTCKGTTFDEVEVQFQASNKTFPLITICHNGENDETVLTHHIIRGSALNDFEVSNNRPSFKEAQYYKEIDANKAYSIKSQIETISQLVGLKPLAEQYIQQKKSFYFARGHQSPDGDFVHIYEQNATYYFLNCVPQWQSINNGNWKALETGAKKYAISKKIDLEVWTGTKGVLTLDDNSGKPVEIYLSINGKMRLPAPMTMWKVIHDPKNKLAVVVLVINNPHLKNVPKDHNLCPDICNKVSWVKWKLEDLPKGYTYCCEYESAKHFLKLVPDLGKVNILT